MRLCKDCKRPLAGKGLPSGARCRDCDPDGHPLLAGLSPRYSGPESFGFWEAVRALKGKEREAARLMGRMLQDLERSVLRYVEDNGE